MGIDVTVLSGSCIKKLLKA